ncbi:MAG: single-stranded DNA-binding protein [Sandaracinaceae bacterium]|nr:single-stranded DNA-binding protein [Sandaracinaceae bacterium]
MAEGLNRVMLIGNLGADPELRYTQGNQPVLSMRLATTESFNNRAGERQERTEWHAVTLWGKRAEALSKFLAKGERIFVEGRIQYRQWEDRDGNKRWSTDIVASNVILLGGRGGRRDSGGDFGGGPPPGGGDFGGGDFGGGDFDDDVPF